MKQRSTSVDQTLRTLIFFYKIIITCVFDLIIQDHFTFEAHVCYLVSKVQRSQSGFSKIIISFLSAKKIKPKVKGVPYFLVPMFCSHDL